jgi:methylated-DNA-protein-cysteine methyltransferase-like protein
VAADFRGKVIAVIEGLRPGEVVSYGDVAAQAGYPGAARGVGSVLSASEGLAWWRVVMADGRLAPGKEREQARRLRAEGVSVVAGRVARRFAPPSGRLGATVGGEGQT